MSAHTLLLLSCAIVKGQIAQRDLWDILNYAEMAKVENFKIRAAWDYLRINNAPRWNRRVR